ncbi:NEL-type E3 ubiquitin ligase domain-containing protein [Pseudomonas orientalis]|uniref:NEL-type E3 ubiquitin ligase domain-containing protein n=1 Tax=Pseudomonas orientalis TaxID=76758 RepID=UPI000F58B0EF|nr:DUF6543 domain-containing protein [Pseudomonas orientalis]AZE87317.1 hypothetical protein C4J97_0588 [Pseudomonas orientalis]
MPDATFNADLRGVHYDFLKQRVPNWFMKGTPQRQEELGKHEMDIPAWYLAATHTDKTTLAARHTRFRETLNSIEEHLGRIEDVLTFAEQPLKDAIKKEFNLELDVRNVFFVRKYGAKGARDDFYGAFVFEQQHDPSLTYTYRGISLLEAALANFEAAEEQPSSCNDCQLITTFNPQSPHIIATFSAVNAHAVAITPHAFAKLCRTLNLGALYQAHIKAVVEPADAEERQTLEEQLEEHHRQQLALCAEIARLQVAWGISADAYRMLQQVMADPATATLDNKPVTFAALKLLDSVLVGPLLIGPDRQRSERAERLVVYIPNDPQQPLREYASSAAFMADLRARLHDPSYRRFFSRFIPVREQDGFFARFDRLYKPAGNNTNSQAGYPLRTPLATLPIQAFVLTGDLWQRSRQAYTSKILSDARAVAVPTEDEDRKARLERLESFFEAAVSVFNLAAFVVPGLGPVMLAVGASQMCYEVYEGIEAYEQGEPRQMWAHFASVALNVAFIATGSKVLPAVQWQSAVDHLKRVTLPTGKQMLWNPDLTRYASPLKPAPGARPDALGLYEHEGQQLVPFGDTHYQVRQDPQTGQYRIQHPTRPDAYAPELEHNHNGVWSHELEEPLTWDEPTLHKRLGIAEQADPLRISGVETDALRQTMVDHEPLPLLLDDTIQRFELHRQLTTFVEQIKSTDPLVYQKADPALQFDMLQRRGLLPDNVPLKVIGPTGEVLWETAGAPTSLRKRVMVLTESAMAQGRLLRELLYTLQGIDPQLKEFPGSPEESLEVRAGRLRQYLGDAVDSLKGPLLEERYRALTPTPDADVQRLLDAYPALPTRVAEQLLQGAAEDELKALRSTGRLSEALAARAQWCAQETRVTRAYEGLQLDTQRNLDSHRLALRTLETLPGWHRGSRMELRQYSAEGTVLEAIGSAEFPHKKNLVLLESGQFLASMPGDFYSAIWEQLSLDERQRLGLSSALELKQAIQHSPLPREPLRAVLVEHPLRRPEYDPAAHLLGGGRGFRRLLSRAANAAKSHEDRVRKLFPSFSEEQVSAFIQSLGEDVAAQLERREEEFHRLKKDLKKWLHTYGSSDTWPRDVAQEIKRCWRRETGSQLRLDAEWNSAGQAGELPSLTADFKHVERLVLSGFSCSGNNGRLFLDNFTHLKGLVIGRAQLRELPPVVGEMTGLKELNLHSSSQGSLRLTEHSAGMLSKLNALESLDLANNPLGVLPDFSAMQQLKSLYLGGTQIDRWPSGLRTQKGMKIVDLARNQLREVPLENLSPPAEELATVVQINSVTNLWRNPFPRDYWKTFDRYWKHLYETRPDLLPGDVAAGFDATDSPASRLRSVYLDLGQLEVWRSIWAWGEGAEAQVAGLVKALNTLQNQLDGWVITGGSESEGYVPTGRRASDATSLNARMNARQRIERCWRMRRPSILGEERIETDVELDLGGLSLSSLPNLDADFSHVRSLQLSNMDLTESPEGFLARFKGVRHLNLSFNRLRESPLALEQMQGLRHLDLSTNRIRFTPESANILSSRASLQVLNLSANPLILVPDFSQLTELRVLDLSHTHINTWPTGLGLQPQLRELRLTANLFMSVPESLIAPPDEQLAQSARLTGVTHLDTNPLSAQTQTQIHAYGERLRAAGLSTADHPDQLVLTARSTIFPIPLPAIDTNFDRWTVGLSMEEITTRRAQWEELSAQAGSSGFFDVLKGLEAGAGGQADLRRRVWELIDALSEYNDASEQLRKELFEWAGEATCCDRAALTFNNLEIRLMAHKAKALARDSSQGKALMELARGLFRLDEVEKIALRDIDQRRTAINTRVDLTDEQKRFALARLEEVEIRLAYRQGLKDRLNLPGQTEHTRFVQHGNVTEQMLDDAYLQVTRLEGSAREFQAMLAQEFWKDYITHKYSSRLAAQGGPHQQAMAALMHDTEAGLISQAACDAKAESLQAQYAIEEAQLIETLSREEIALAL